ncbi:putative reverse transcriptase zinc-binding domain-containing protein [Helianthus annuus]|nr:putative reverse transcriptase zinc-binding domain-containing protein [Helianthus annuus]
MFSVKSVKNLLYPAVEINNRYIMEWCKWVLEKCNIHAWRSEMEMIPTGVALRKRNVFLGGSTCPVCNSADESTDHLFNACFVVANVWNGVSAWCKIPNFFAFSIKDLLDMFKLINVSEKIKEVIHGIVVIVCWSLWRARNNWVFSSIPIKIDKIISEVKSLGFLWYSNRSKNKDIVWRDWVSFDFM